MKKSKDVFFKPMLKGSLTQFIVFCFDGNQQGNKATENGWVIYVEIAGEDDTANIQLTFNQEASLTWSS